MREAERLARIFYSEYGAAIEHRDHSGPMPRWSELPGRSHLALEAGAQAVADAVRERYLTRFGEQLQRVEQKLDRNQREEEQDMGDIDDKLTTLEGDETAESAKLDALDADEQRELADLQALKDQGQQLTPDQAARFDALDAKMQADAARVQAEDDAINAADPAPVTPPADNGGDTPAV